MKDYFYESGPSESSADGTLLYISNHLSYKPKSDLYIYKSTELEPIFIEILNTKKANVSVGCIYCHPHTNLNESNEL